METTITSVAVPQHRLGAFYEHLATLFTGDESSGTSEVPELPDLTLDDIREVYFGGSGNQPWRDLLLELSLHPGEEVHWPELCEAIGLTRRVASGVIGAGERRCKGKVPYTKRYTGDETYFEMSPEVSKMVQMIATTKDVTKDE